MKIKYSSRVITFDDVMRDLHEKRVMKCEKEDMNGSLAYGSTAKQGGN